MKRTVALRGMQLLDHFKTASMIMLAFMLAIGIFTGMSFLFEDHISIHIEVLDIFNGIRQLLATLVALWGLIIFFADGTSDFDTAMRFGHHRRHYFMVNGLIYIFLSLLTAILDYLNQTNSGLSWDVLLTYFFKNVLGCFLIAIFAFAVYKWGWKILFVLIGLNFLGGVGFGLLGLAFADSLSRIVQTLSELPNYAYQGMRLALLLVIVAFYHGIINKIEVK